MGDDYYGRNDYRDYLAHYGVKGMKWKKRKKRALTPDEIRAIRRNRLQQQMVRDMNANAKNEMRARTLERREQRKERDDGSASAASFVTGGSFTNNKHLGVISGRRVTANSGHIDPRKFGKKKAKKVKGKVGKESIKNARKSLSKAAFNAISKMQGTGGSSVREQAARSRMTNDRNMTMRNMSVNRARRR